MTDYTINFSYEPTRLYRDLFGPLYYTPIPTQPKPPLPAQRIADEVAQLAKDHSVDLGTLTRAVNEVEAERRTTAEKAVKGALDIAGLGSPKARRFRLAWQHSDKSKSIKVDEGIEFADDRTDKSKEDGATRVYLGVLAGVSLSRLHTSMKKLRESLDNQKIVYLIDYID